MEKDHNISINSSEHSFTTYEDFLLWKAEEEQSTDSYYVQHGGAVTHSSIRYRYLYCNRSGTLKSKGKGKRNIKVQKSSKIGSMCTAYMKVEEDLVSRSCKVQYFFTHSGHVKELAHLPIPQNLKVEIGAKLEEGVFVDRIMDYIRVMCRDLTVII